MSSILSVSVLVAYCARLQRSLRQRRRPFRALVKLCAHNPRRGKYLRQRPSALVVGQVLASCPFCPLRLRLLRVC